MTKENLSEIAKKARMSFRDIGAIIRAADEETTQQLKGTNLSKDSGGFVHKSQSGKELDRS